MSGLPKMLGDGRVVDLNSDHIIPPRTDHVVYVYHPGDPKGTMRRHAVEAGGMVEIPPGHVFSTVSVAPDVKVSVSAREKDYGV